MIEISVALNQDQVIELLNKYDQDGITFTFKEKKGIKLYFETSADDLEAAAKAAKAEIKTQPWGSVLYFQSTPAK
ncbi:hypothetical protein RU97_GL000467 [Enterococcus canis]|uniref:Uncharacterized protein n=1 Tax=Enterococcus canis TaxID=214095 RepID=A0A1L8RKI7_9ENTE|nr:hypothetical protein [Enterococcus canis]OJG20234.1 hypothetical protein RU97_GL000467 [Enterococcus canis]